MIALWLTVGLASAPSIEPVSPMACLSSGPALVAAWAKVHPGWHVAKWRCGPQEDDA